LVDINQPPIQEALNFDSKNRAIGLGVMGLSDLLEQLNLAYDSEQSYQLVDELMEFVSYAAISESADLAEEKGSYANFQGSMWSKGYVPADTIDILEDNRQQAITVKRDSTRHDWAILRERVKKGMRNATLMAIAPTANIGLVAGTAPGIDPRFAQIFSRNTLSGKYLELNFNLVRRLKELNLWEKVREDILAVQGDLSSIETIPDDIKAVYKDSFSVKPEAFIEVAARAQKWVDQGISRNMYLETRDTEEIMGIYNQAWKKGLKTTYYLHMKPRHSAEQSTVKVNKAGATGKKGFGALLAAKPTETNENISVGQACPIDPQERLQCESCQ
jgi:ribonucleoside-diphosphate reductase alpha chain